MRIMVLGGDGFCGWPTALHLSAQGHHVAVADNFAHRRFDRELGTGSLVPIEDLRTRLNVWEELTGKGIIPYVGDVCDYGFTRRIITAFQPDAIVHFAEQCSAPYSMLDYDHAVYTQTNNVVSTLSVLHAISRINPGIHLVKLGSMGVYGWPNIGVEEGWLEVEHKGRREVVLYPKRAADFYHLSKIYDSHNIDFAVSAWQLRDTVRCVQLACENPPEQGEYRVFNQVTETMPPVQVAELVAGCFPGAAIVKLPNPRVEPDDGYYNVVHTKLEQLGLQPHLLSAELVHSLADIAKRYAHRVRPELLQPTYDWHQAA
jgi:nucleoside-diphosphate-sugar epimerase